MARLAAIMFFLVKQLPAFPGVVTSPGTNARTGGRAVHGISRCGRPSTQIT
jgi:hypothetical protein